MEIQLKDIQDILGDRQIAVAGELTKMFEEVFHGTVSQAQSYFAEHPARGEYTLVVAGQSEKEGKWGEEKLISVLKSEIKMDAPLSQIAKEVAKQSGWPRRQVYARLTEIQEQLEDA